MSVVVSFRFPLGRYHATPWDQSANEGAVEWPPSPWRLLRALVSTWHTRWPDLASSVVDELLEALGDPPSYRLPLWTAGHTRHYLPDVAHRKGAPGATDLTLDSYLWVAQDAELLVRWDAELSEEQREVLAKLLELMPYLGRSESVCEARLHDGDIQLDESWWHPAAAGTGTVRLLAPQRPVRRPILELSTVEVRRQQRTMPPETQWVQYTPGHVQTTSEEEAPAPVAQVDAIRFAVVSPSRVRLMATHGVLLADEVHRRVIRSLDGGRREVLGYDGAATDHQHLHWLPLPAHAERGAEVVSFLVWVPTGLTPDEVAKIVSTRFRRLSGRRGGAGGYEIKGFPPVDLLLQAAGPVTTVAPELCGPARHWVSLTPYLPVRHRKPRRETFDEFLGSDIGVELGYRRLPAAQARRLSATQVTGSDRWAREFRRYRSAETMKKSRPGLGVALDFGEEVQGPLALGQLSHFGFGLFTPVEQ